MKKIIFNILHEYTGPSFETNNDHYWIFIQKEKRLHPIQIPKELAPEIPAWACFTIDPVPKSTTEEFQAPQEDSVSGSSSFSKNQSIHPN